MSELEKKERKILKSCGDQTKIPFSIKNYIAPALLRVAKVEHEGAEKYGDDNWHYVSKEDDITHAIRHLILSMTGSNEDGKDDHLAHAACRIMMAIGLEEKEKRKHCVKPVNDDVG